MCYAIGCLNQTTFRMMWKIQVLSIYNIKDPKVLLRRAGVKFPLLLQPDNTFLPLLLTPMFHFQEQYYTFAKQQGNSGAQHVSVQVALFTHTHQKPSLTECMQSPIPQLSTHTPLSSSPGSYFVPRTAAKYKK